MAHWLNAFSHRGNETTAKLQLAYVNKPDRQTHRYFTGHHSVRDAKVSGLGSERNTVEVNDSEVTTLPAPMPERRRQSFSVDGG